jgi:GNAT superfamily N-acetyltransferase
MTSVELITPADLALMQGLAERVTGRRPDLITSGASVGELAWIFGRQVDALGSGWPRRLWFDDGVLVAFAWVFLPHRIGRTDGTVKEVTGADLIYQVDPDHQELVDAVIDWFGDVASGLERSVVPCASDEFGLERWAAHGYVTDPASLGETGGWTQLNQRDLVDLELPVLPDGFRFRTADEVGAQAAYQAHVDAWAPTTYTIQGYEGVRRTPPYRGDLHVLIEAPDSTMAASAIIWLDEANKTVEFEPVGTHPGFRRLGLGRALMLHGLHRARDAGAEHATVVCLGAPGYPKARGLYYSVGFKMFTRDAPLIKTV